MENNINNINLDNLNDQDKKILEQIRAMGSNIKINAKSPAYKINLIDKPTDEQLAGMYMVITEINYKEDADMEDVTSDTIVLVNVSHKIALSHVIFGLLTGLIGQGIIDEDYAHRIIIQILKLVDGPVMYFDLLVDIKEILETKLFKIIPSKFDAVIFKDRLVKAMEAIWFIPYNVLDDYAERMKTDAKEYNKK